jgi:general stress protein 26
MPATSDHAPTAERPVMPRDYGVPSSTAGLIAWADVEPRLDEARVYWIATAGPDGQARVRPVDGLYVDGTLYVGGSPETRWVRDIAANPHVSVHLDGSSDVLILEGEARILDGLDRPTAERLAAVSRRKYPEYGMTADNYAGPGTIAFRPAVGFAWSSFPKDVTRFRFR